MWCYVELLGVLSAGDPNTNRRKYDVRMCTTKRTRFLAGIEDVDVTTSAFVPVHVIEACPLGITYCGTFVLIFVDGRTDSKNQCWVLVVAKVLLEIALLLARVPDKVVVSGNLSGKELISIERRSVLIDSGCVVPSRVFGGLDALTRFHVFTPYVSFVIKH